MKRTFEKELPEGYREVFAVDAKDKKTSVILNLVGLVIGLVLIGALFLSMGFPWMAIEKLIPFNLLLIASILVYMVCHELVHGLAYKLTTGQKLKFGLTSSVAYCGVPDIYVYRSTALISLLAPFTVFGVLFIIGTAVFWGKPLGFGSGVLLAAHFGGCVGDIYDTLLYLFKFRDPDTLMRDTGPKQSFYLPKEK